MRCFLFASVLRFALLPCYRQIQVPSISIKEKAVTRLIFYTALGKEEAVAAAKDTDALLLLNLHLRSLKCVPLSWYMKIDSNQYIDINMIYDNLVSELSDVLLQLHACYQWL